MSEYLKNAHNNHKPTINSGSQDNLFHNLNQIEEAKEKMDKDIESFQRLAQYYYDIKAEESEPGKDGLYTIVSYQEKEILVPIGRGEYTSEMFTNKHMNNSIGFLYGPLNLFVVENNTHDDTNVNPRTFLNEYARFYSPVGGQVHMHTPGTPIEYGKHNKIVSYEEAVNALQNADIRKEFYSRASDRNNVDEDFCKDMRKLKEKIETMEKTTEKLENRYKHKIKFDHEDEDYVKMRNCLAHLSDEDIQKMYDLIQNFDSHKGVFIQPDNI